MKSDTMTVREIFQDRRQYCVPFYQRAYVWSQRDQWEPLWGDISQKAQERQVGGSAVPHFLGAVVVEPQEKSGLRGVDILHIIDGQQRLTTLQYVLASLVLALRETKAQGLEALLESCRNNGNPETMLDPVVERYKVWPTFRDRDAYVPVMNAKNLDELRSTFPAHFTQRGDLRLIGIVHPASLAAVWYFTHKFIEFISEEGADQATQAEALASAILQDLKMVSVFLEPQDDAQIIFETLNGRGATLHATDLIRNFIFMRADRDGANAKALYDQGWVPFETEYWSADLTRGRLKKPRLEWLIHTTLQAETQSEVDLPRLYAEYRNYALGKKGAPSKSADTQLATLREYAAHYQALTDSAGSRPIARFGRRISAYDITTLHALALMVSVAKIPDDAKIEMFNDLVSFVVRRAVCGLPTKNYNNVFMSALRHLARTSTTPSELRAALSSSTSDVSRWPLDAEFRNACITGDVYYGRLDAPKMRSFLTEIEGALRAGARTEEPELPSLVALDIDHIMPRSWRSYWPLLDGSQVREGEIENVQLQVLSGTALDERQQEIKDRLAAISTLGNLTLLNLSVNRQAQNFAFQSKRDLLISNTNLSLNVQLLKRDTWTVLDIEERGSRLADVALGIWAGPR